MNRYSLREGSAVIPVNAGIQAVLLLDSDFPRYEDLSGSAWLPGSYHLLAGVCSLSLWGGDVHAPPVAAMSRQAVAGSAVSRLILSRAKSKSGSISRAMR